MFLAFRLKYIFTVNLTAISLINKNHVNIKNPKKVQYQSIQFGEGAFFFHLKDQLVEGYWVDSSFFFFNVVVATCVSFCIVIFYSKHLVAPKTVHIVA